ncbi:MAG: NUDIX domain-containing protein [Bacteroidetes bacterium]|nr:NUDIX domain-containing protein [Bacteroidota bacterium]
MNKRIYFNESFILFTSNAPLFHSKSSFKKTDEDLLNYLETEIKIFLNTVKPSNITLNETYFELVVSIFKNKYYYIEAAGGLIERLNNFLVIERLGKWDLPKGKIEKGESPKHAAERECEEECGIKGLALNQPLCNTYHCYSYKKLFALKKTYWFTFNTNFSGELNPQTEENITKVEWKTENQLKTDVFLNTYAAIKDVLTIFFKWN